MGQEHSSSRVGRRGDHYRALLAEQEASGLSLRAFAAERGLSQWTLYDWRRRLGRSTPRSAVARARRASGFVAVDVVGPRAGAGDARRFEVVLADGCRVLVPRDVPLEHLAELVRALRAC